MTIVPELIELYRELGGTAEIAKGTTSVDALKLVYAQLGGEEEFDNNATISTIIKAIAKVMGIPDTEVEGYSKETIFDYNTSDLQSNIVVADGKITGDLEYLDDGQLVDAHGEGNFLAVECVEYPADVTSVKLGMYPTYRDGQFIYDDSGLQEIINDPDKGGAYKITDKNIQAIKLVVSDGKRVHKQIFDLSGLNCKPAEN